MFKRDNNIYWINWIFNTKINVFFSLIGLVEARKTNTHLCYNWEINMTSAAKNMYGKNFYIYSFIYICKGSFFYRSSNHAHMFLLRKAAYIWKKCQDQVLRKCRLSTSREIRIALPFKVFNSESIDCHISHTSLPVPFHYIYSAKLYRLYRSSLDCYVFR